MTHQPMTRSQEKHKEKLSLITIITQDGHEKHKKHLVIENI